MYLHRLAKLPKVNDTRLIPINSNSRMSIYREDGEAIVIKLGKLPKLNIQRNGMSKFLKQFGLFQESGKTRIFGIHVLFVVRNSGLNGQ